MKTSTLKAPTKPDIERATHYLQKARQRLSRHRSLLDSLSKEEIIRKVRKTREHLWEKKLAARF